MGFINTLPYVLNLPPMAIIALCVPVCEDIGGDYAADYKLLGGRSWPQAPLTRAPLCM